MVSLAPAWRGPCPAWSRAPFSSTPFARSDTISDTTWGFGDVEPIFQLKWNAGVNNYMTYITGDIPVGAYQSTRLSNIGIGHGAIDAGGGYTYFNPQTGHELSGVLGFTYNFLNNPTQYQSGVDLHFDWGASQFVSKQVMLGLVGYVYKELGCDSGSGDHVGCFQSQVVGVGPQIGFLFPVGDMQGYLNFKAYGEFAAANRPSGWNTWLTFSISPPTPGAPPTTTQQYSNQSIVEDRAPLCKCLGVPANAATIPRATRQHGTIDDREASQLPKAEVGGKPCDGGRRGIGAQKCAAHVGGDQQSFNYAKTDP